MDKDITFGEERERNKFINVTTTQQEYALPDHIISFAIWSSSISFYFETDDDVDSNSFLVPAGTIYTEGLKVNTKIAVKALSGTGDIYFRGIR